MLQHFGGTGGGWRWAGGGGNLLHGKARGTAGLPLCPPQHRDATIIPRPPVLYGTAGRLRERITNRERDEGRKPSSKQQKEKEERAKERANNGENKPRKKGRKLTNN